MNNTIRWMASLDSPERVREYAKENQIKIISEHPHVLTNGIDAVNFVIEISEGEKTEWFILRDDGPRNPDKKQPVNRFAIIPS